MRHEGSGARLGIGAVERQVIVSAVGPARAAVTEMFAAIVEPPRPDAVARLRLCGGPAGYTVVGGRTSDVLDGSLEDAVRALRHQLTRHFMASRPDLIWMHAAAAERSGSAVLLAGPSGCGKSTLVTDLIRRGYRYLGDDVIPFEARTGLVHPLPISPRLRRACADPLQPEEATRLPRYIVRLGSNVIARTPARPALIVFPDFSDGASEARACTASETAMRLLQHVVDPGALDEAAMRGVGRLAATTPGVRVHYREPDAAAGFIARTLEAGQLGAR